MSEKRGGLGAGSDYTNHSSPMSNASSMLRSSPDNAAQPAQHTRRFSLPTAHLLNSITNRGKRESQASSQQLPKQQQHQHQHQQQQQKQKQSELPHKKSRRRVLSGMGLAMKSTENLTSVSMYDVSTTTQHRHTSSLASRGSSEKPSSYKKADNTFLTRSKAWGSAGKRLLSGHRSSSKDITNHQPAQIEHHKRGHSSRSTLVEPLRDRPGPRLQALSMSPDEPAPKEDLWEAYNLKNESRENHIHEQLGSRHHAVADKPPVLELPGITVPWKDENEEIRLRRPPSTSASVPGLLRAGVPASEQQQQPPLSRRGSRGDSLSLLTMPSTIDDRDQPERPRLARPKSAAFDITSAIAGDELEQHLGAPMLLAPLELESGSRISMSFLDSRLETGPENKSQVVPPIQNLSLSDHPSDVISNRPIQPYSLSASTSTSSTRPLRLQVDTSCQKSHSVSSPPLSLKMSPDANGSPGPSDGSMSGSQRKHRIPRKPVGPLDTVSSSTGSTPDTPRQDLDVKPTGSRLEDKIDGLNRRLGQLEVQQQTLETLVRDLNKALMPVECGYETRREIKKSLETFEGELADVKKEQHDLGLKLTRYLKKKDDERTLGDSSGGMWSRRVTG